MTVSLGMATLPNVQTSLLPVLVASLDISVPYLYRPLFGKNCGSTVETLLLL